jgi:hypothetical protein
MLTPAQQLIIKNYILANPELANQPPDGDGLGVIRDHLNQPSSPAVLVWNVRTPADAIFDTVDMSKYTPSDAADTTVIFQNRAILCQTKLMVLQALLQNREFLNAEKANIRAGLRDSLIQIPSGAGGAYAAAAGASGVNALNACTTNTTIAEALLLSVQSVTTGTVSAGIIGFRGEVSNDDVDAARKS